MRLLKCAGIVVLHVAVLWVLAIVIRFFLIERFPTCPMAIWERVFVLLASTFAFLAYQYIMRPSFSRKRVVLPFLGMLSVAFVFTSGSTLAAFATIHFSDSILFKRYETLLSAQFERDSRFSNIRFRLSYGSPIVPLSTHVWVTGSVDSKQDLSELQRLLGSVFVPMTKEVDVTYGPVLWIEPTDRIYDRPSRTVLP